MSLMRDISGHSRRYERVENGWKCRICNKVVQVRQAHTENHNAVEVEVIEKFMAEVETPADSETGDA